MRVNQFSFLLGIIILTLSSFAIESMANNSGLTSIYRPHSLLIKRHALKLGIEGSYVNTQKHWDDQGNSVPLQGQESYKRSDFQAEIDYGLFSSWQFLTGTNFRNVNSTKSSGGRESNSGMESLWIGSYVSPFQFGEIDFSMKFLYKRPLYQNNFKESEDLETSTIALGDDSEEYNLGIVWGTEFGEKKYLSMEIDFVKRVDFSDEIFFKLEVPFWGQNIAIVPGIEGIASLSNDPYGGKSSNRPYVKRGSTYSVNSANRNYLAPTLEIPLKINDKMRFFGGGKYRIKGNSIDSGYDISFGIILNIFDAQNKIVSLNDPIKDQKNEIFQYRIKNQEMGKEILTLDVGYGNGVNVEDEVEIVKRSITGKLTVLGSGVVLSVEKEKSKIKVEYIDQEIGVTDLDDIYVRGKKI